jgi:hypothetical protein
MPNLGDYQLALKMCTDVVAGPECVSVMLYGSLARNLVRPGHSDVLDAFVVVSDDVLRNELDHARLIEKFLVACASVSALGLPFHPFHYYGCDEVLTYHPALFLPTWKRHGFSRVQLGRDLRSELNTTSHSILLARAAFYSFCRYLLSLGHLASRNILTPSQRFSIIGALTRSRKVLPLLVCVACGHWVEQSEALATLPKAVPDCDIAPLTSFGHLELDSLSRDALIQILTMVVRCTEDLHRAVRGGFELER